MRGNFCAVLAGVSAIALIGSAQAQTQTPPEDPGVTQGQVAGPVQTNADQAAPDGKDVVVTGSRVVNGNQAPTPVTTVTADELQQTTPSNLPDALNRLPQFSGQRGQQRLDNPGSASSGNFLNLRSFGPQRNLILFDGSRVPPTSAFGANTGAVNVDVLPQLLIQRVEVVTGGASAVYGSDAVTGVVNFVLDKKFNGVKTLAQAGISTYGDNESWRVGWAAGLDLFEGRGHFEASFDHFNSKGIPYNDSRPEARGYPLATGTGTAANPFHLIPNGRFLLGSRGSFVLAGPVGARDMVFNSNGVATPFTHGSATGSGGIESGGDGTTFNQNQLVAPLRTNQAFARLDYDLSDKISAHVQGSFNTSDARYTFFPSFFFAATIFSGNPYIPTTIQNAITAANAPSIVLARVNDKADGYPGVTPRASTRSAYLKTGLEGSFLGNFRWNIDYIYGRSVERVANETNVNTFKAAAALDAVRDPATGRVVCGISLTPFASRFPTCEPLNLFGPTAPTISAYDGITDETRFRSTYTMHDVSGSVSGSPFSTWAGPVKVAFSGEYRNLTLRNVTNAEPSERPDCSGVRGNCSPTALAYQTNVTASVRSSDSVKEAAGEILIPLVADVPFIKAFDLNGAVRFTDYRTSGSVTTWKVGANWQVNDDLRFRGTTSRDIRAPTLQDLFAPPSSSATGYTDLHTGIAAATTIVTQGNRNLSPEIGRTYTAGLVYQPSWFAGFSVAVDYYNINLRNAIVTVNPGDPAVQRECETSNGTSPVCALFERPLPFSDRSAANFPTRVFTQGINAATIKTHGVDAEVNYKTGLGNAGQLGLRGLLSYQPVLSRQNSATSVPTRVAGIAGLSKWRVNVGIDYSVADLGIAVQERWQSGQHPFDPRTIFYTVPEINAYSYTDITLTYKVKVGGGSEIVPFVTVENLFNKRPPITGAGALLGFPTAPGFDVIGRYVTAGFRTRF